jgi:hypothetical protein
MTDGLDALTLDIFRGRVGERFRIRPQPDHAIHAELIEARPLAESSRAQSGTSPRRAPFALVFRATLASALPQRIYRVEHDELGPYDIFLVPVGRDGAGILYEAIFT